MRRVLDFFGGHLPEGDDLNDVKGISASAETLRRLSFFYKQTRIIFFKKYIFVILKIINNLKITDRYGCFIINN